MELKKKYKMKESYPVIKADTAVTLMYNDINRFFYKNPNYKKEVQRFVEENPELCTTITGYVTPLTLKDIQKSEN